jgi:hypothetical protein
VRTHRGRGGGRNRQANGVRSHWFTQSLSIDIEQGQTCATRPSLTLFLGSAANSIYILFCFEPWCPGRQFILSIHEVLPDAAVLCPALSLSVPSTSAQGSCLMYRCEGRCTAVNLCRICMGNLQLLLLYISQCSAPVKSSAARQRGARGGGGQHHTQRLLCQARARGGCCFWWL